MSATKAIGSLIPPALPPSGLFDHDHSSHIAQFYEDDAHLIKSVSRFIGTALGAGDSGIVIGTPKHRDSLARALKRLGLDIASIERQGRYVSLDAAEVLSGFLTNGFPDEHLFAETMGLLIRQTKAKAEGKDRRVVIFGEMVAQLWSQGRSDAALRLEQSWNELGRSEAFSLHCGYRIRDFHREDHGEAFLQICQQHTGIIPGESYGVLATEEERLRKVARLQQRAEALESEIAERKRVEKDLRSARDELERRVAERTLELRQKNLQIVEQAQTLARTNDGLRQLSARLLRVQDEERRRIARDLHDSTGQFVALLSMNLSALESEARDKSPEIAASIAENAQIVNQVSNELRTISYLLHPPLLDEMGLESALRWYVKGFSQRSGINVTLNLARDFGRLQPDLETAVFRVVQECLTNIHRHSESASAAIQLYQSGDGLTLQIEDAGKGIAPEKLLQIASFGAAGVGLRGMRERIKDFSGNLEIASGEGGTQIRVSIPLTV
jgi:signal transduction histidine kinase